MNLLEIIQIRIVSGSQDDLLTLLKGFFSGADRPDGLLKFKVYSHLLLKGDLSLHLIWDGDTPCRPGTPLGLRLSQTLKEFGLINHNLWKEEE